ncbi:MAG: hypothetical protein Q9169_003496 [Polycauliona sp. 2 TL-2023]
MPRLGSSEQAFLAIVKTLNKGKGKENVPTDMLLLAQPSSSKINGHVTPAAPRSIIVGQASWQNHDPAAAGAQEQATETWPVEARQNTDEIICHSAPSQPSPATYTVIGSNFAPETTAADVEAALFDVVGPMKDCRIVSQSPIVIAEMVFTEIARAVHVIALFDNQKADGYLLRFYMKPDVSNNLPKAPPAKLTTTLTQEDAINGKVESEQRPASPVLRGRGRARYRPGDYPGEPLEGDQAPASVGNSDTHQTKNILKQPREQNKDTAPMDREEHSAAPTNGGQDHQAVNGEEHHPLGNRTGTGGRRWHESWSTKLDNFRQLRLESEIDREIRITKENNRKEDEEVEAAIADSIRTAEEDALRRSEAMESTIAASPATKTTEDTAPATAAVVDEPTGSRQPSSATTIAETTPQPAAGPKSSKPLLSSGHAFLEAFNKRPTPPKYTTIKTSSIQDTPLPDELLPDELPAATKTEPHSINGQDRSASPVAQIRTTGTLQTPTGEHTIHLARPTSSVTNTAARPNISIRIETKDELEIPAQTLARANPRDHSISPTHPPLDHSILPPRPPPPASQSKPPKKPPPPTLTLLSGSGPRGYVYQPRHYARDELVRIGKAYRQKVFLALLAREGRGRLVIGITEGV